MQDLIAAYADCYLQLTEAIDGLEEEELNFKPDDTSWSVKEIVLHVCDTEIVAVHRMKSVISETAPLLTVFEQDRWAARQRYGELEMGLHLELFGLLRESMLPILSGLSEEDWNRYGIHTEIGKVTLRELVVKFTDHVAGHIRQIERVREAYRGGFSF